MSCILLVIVLLMGPVFGGWEWILTIFSPQRVEKSKRRTQDNMRMPPTPILGRDIFKRTYFCMTVFLFKSGIADLFLGDGKKISQGWMVSQSSWGQPNRVAVSQFIARRGQMPSSILYKPLERYRFKKKHQLAASDYPPFCDVAVSIESLLH